MKRGVRLLIFIGECLKSKLLFIIQSSRWEGFAVCYFWLKKFWYAANFRYYQEWYCWLNFSHFSYVSGGCQGKAKRIERRWAKRHHASFSQCFQDCFLVVTKMFEMTHSDFIFFLLKIASTHPFICDEIVGLFSSFFFSFHLVDLICRSFGSKNFCVHNTTKCCNAPVFGHDILKKSLFLSLFLPQC